jgi:predicted ester cyclase
MRVQRLSATHFRPGVIESNAMKRTLLAVGVAVLSIENTLVAAQEPDQVSREEKNKAVAMRVFEEIFNQKKLEVASEIYAPEFVNHGVRRDVSLQVDQAAARSEIKAFPDIRMTVELAVAQGDFVTVVWIFRGTHTAFGYGLPPTGARIEMRGITVWRIVDGKIRDEWTSFNELTGYMQVLRHLRWFLLGLLLALTLLVWKVPKLIRNFRRRNETRTT